MQKWTTVKENSIHGIVFLCDLPPIALFTYVLTPPLPSIKLCRLLDRLDVRGVLKIVQSSEFITQIVSSDLIGWTLTGARLHLPLKNEALVCMLDVFKKLHHHRITPQSILQVSNRDYGGSCMTIDHRVSVGAFFFVPYFILFYFITRCRYPLNSQLPSKAIYLTHSTLFILYYYPI